MTRRDKFIFNIGTIYFSIGIIIGFLLLGTMTWADLEASLFSTSLDAEKTLTTLNCPVFISPHETKQVKATLKNPTEKDWERYIRAFISEGYVTLVREIKGSVTIPSDGRETITWNVFPEDAAYNRIVFFRVYVHAKYPYPSLDASCGIMKIDLLGLTGNQILFLMVFCFIGFCAVGGFLWRIRRNRPQDPVSNSSNSLYALGTVLMIGILTSYFGLWVFGILLFAASTLLLGIIIGRIMTR